MNSHGDLRNSKWQTYLCFKVEPMENEALSLIAKEINVGYQQAKITYELLENGATLPFIARYRKEQTGGLNEQDIAGIQEKVNRYKIISKRRQSILQTLREQGNLTNDLKRQLEATWDLQKLEDLYLPFKPKRQTRAEKARKAGLEPLAQILWNQLEGPVSDKARGFLSQDIPDVVTAIQGARDIVAEWVSEDRGIRQSLRNLYQKSGIIQAKVISGKEEMGRKYQDYFSYEESLTKMPAHRLLAILRGEREGILRIKIGPVKAEALSLLKKRKVKYRNEAAMEFETAMADGYQRLLKPSLDTEFRNQAREKADEEAIGVFGENLRQRLLSPPLGNQRVLAIDPGYKSGCKVALLDRQGHFITETTIFPNPPQSQLEKAEKSLKALVNKHSIEAIAVGNGTAGRETENWIRGITGLKEISVFSVDEDGASVYSASQTAQREFPSLDLTVRGAISIGRRLMDPLAELVKIEPKSLGIGQYQHDVNQQKLKQQLDQVVIHCVNKVGVNVNTASEHLLRYVAGLGPQLAENMVWYRENHGPFDSRKMLHTVPKLGPKAFEQAAGFLRIPESANPLDNSAVHPESYGLVEQMAKDQHCTIQELLSDSKKRMQIPWEQYLTKTIGWPTLNDIKEELEKPGRDPRPALQEFRFSDRVQVIEDLCEGMILPGIVTNLTNFGAFVDIGLKENGLVHISEMADHYVKDPADVMALHQHCQVKVLGVDLERGRIQLTLKGVG